MMTVSIDDLSFSLVLSNEEKKIEDCILTTAKP